MSNVLIGVLLAFLGAPAQCAFDELGAGARAPGMANAFTAVADDVYAIHYNPAGLAVLERPQLALDYTRLHMGLSDGSSLSRSQMAAASPLGRGRWGTLGLNFNEFSLSDLYNERLIGLSYGKLVYSSPRRGTFFAGLNLNSLNRSFGASPEAGNALDHGAATGGADPVLSGSKGKSAIGADLGFLWRGRRYGAGLAFKNANQPDVGFSGSDKLPISTRLGVSYKSLWLNLAGDLRVERSASGAQDRRVALAAERFFPTLDRGQFGLRGGLTIGTREFREAALGLSYRINKIEFDYAVGLSLGALTTNTGSHRLGMVLHFGSPTAEEELSTELVSQMQRLRERRTQEAGYEAAEVARPADLGRADLAEVRARVLAGEYLLAHQTAIRLLKDTPNEPSVTRLAKRLDIASAFFPELRYPAESWDIALSSGLLNFIFGRDREAVLFVSYAASLNRQAMAIDKLLARMEAATGLKAFKYTPDRTVLQELQAKAADAFRAQDYQRSMRDTQDCLLLDPANLTAIKRLGSILFMMGFYPEAIATWERALIGEVHPQERASIEEYLKRAREAQELKQGPPKPMPGSEAAAPAEPAAPTQARPLEPAVPAAEEPVRASEPEPAKTVAEPAPTAPARASDPREVERLFQKAMDHYARGEMIQAIGALRRVLAIDPKNGPALKALSRIRRTQPEPAQP